MAVTSITFGSLHVRPVRDHTIYNKKKVHRTCGEPKRNQEDTHSEYKTPFLFVVWQGVDVSPLTTHVTLRGNVVAYHYGAGVQLGGDSDDLKDKFTLAQDNVLRNNSQGWRLCYWCACSPDMQQAADTAALFPNASGYVPRAIKFHTDGGQFDIGWTPARTRNGTYVW